MAQDDPEYLITFGPFTHLRVGCVWTLDIGSRFGLWGIGWRRVGFRRIEP